MAFAFTLASAFTTIGVVVHLLRIASGAQSYL